MRGADTHTQVALCSLSTLSSLTLTGSDLVRAGAEENPCPWQIFDDVIFARLEMEADVDICETVCLLSSQPLLPFLLTLPPSIETGRVGTF